MNMLMVLSSLLWKRRINQSLSGELDKGLYSYCLQELSLAPQSREPTGDCHKDRKQKGLAAQETTKSSDTAE